MSRFQTVRNTSPSIATLGKSVQSFRRPVCYEGVDREFIVRMDRPRPKLALEGALNDESGGPHVERPRMRRVHERDADGEEEMEAVLRTVYVDSRIDPDSLTGDEHQIVREARGEGYEESHPFSDAFESLLEALHRRAFIDGNIEKDAGIDRNRGDVLKYGDEYFDYRLLLEA